MEDKREPATAQTAKSSVPWPPAKRLIIVEESETRDDGSTQTDLPQVCEMDDGSFYAMGQHGFGLYRVVGEEAKRVEGVHVVGRLFRFQNGVVVVGAAEVGGEVGILKVDGLKAVWVHEYVDQFRVIEGNLYFQSDDASKGTLVYDGKTVRPVKFIDVESK
jgi:hypothetical protein